MERVFVVRRRDFFDGSWPQGFLRLEPDAAARMLTGFVTAGFFTDRAPAERDPSLKQLIPYCVVRRGEDVFCVRRTTRQGEGRLHGRRSIGLGGHINPIDASVPNKEFFHAALHRELGEELVLPPGSARRARLVGLLNDDASDVGKVHCGLVFELALKAAESARIREIRHMEGGFRRLAAGEGLWQDLAEFETWSSGLLRDYVVAKGAPRSGTYQEGGDP